jgi:hypothetical protein
MQNLWPLALLPLCAGCSALAVAPPAQFDSEYKATLSAVVGQRHLSTKKYAPVEDQQAFGLELDVRQPGEVLGFELALYHSFDESKENPLMGGEVEFQSKITEFSVGWRWKWPAKWIGAQPQLGVGPVFLWQGRDADPNSADDGDTSSQLSPGIYGHAGLSWALGERIHIGIDYRCTFFTHTGILGFLLEDGDVDYGQLGIALGYSF